MTTWHLDVDQVRIVGADARGIEPGELRALVVQAVQDALASAPMPGGRTALASIEVRVPSLTNRAAIAGAVARGVVRAVGGGGRAHG